MATADPEAKILLALLKHLESFVEGQSPALACAWPDEPFEPPVEDGKAQPYLRPFMLPVPNSTNAISEGSTRFSGILQVSVFYPVRKWALQEATTLAGKVADWFVADPTIFYEDIRIEIIVRPDVGPRIDPQSSQQASGGLPHIPVSVRWIALID